MRLFLTLLVLLLSLPTHARDFFTCSGHHGLAVSWSVNQQNEVYGTSVSNIIDSKITNYQTSDMKVFKSFLPQEELEHVIQDVTGNGGNYTFSTSNDCQQLIVAVERRVAANIIKKIDSTYVSTCGGDGHGLSDYVVFNQVSSQVEKLEKQLETMQADPWLDYKTNLFTAGGKIGKWVDRQLKAYDISQMKGVQKIVTEHLEKVEQMKDIHGESQCEAQLSMKSTPRIIELYRNIQASQVDYDKAVEKL
jgi:hypothetical protein